MNLDWNAFGNLIARLSLIALEWYRVIEAQENNTDESQSIKLAKEKRHALAVVIDPTTPEKKLEQVGGGGDDEA